MLEYRLASAQISQNQYRLLPKGFVVEAIDRIASRLPGHGSNVYERRAVKNISDDEHKTVTRWLHALNLPMEDWVNVFWIADRKGISMSLNDFFEHYDDLWYPGSDDVWICSLTDEWVLEFSHEEELSLYCSVQKPCPQNK